MSERTPHVPCHANFCVECRLLYASPVPASTPRARERMRSLCSDQAGPAQRPCAARLGHGLLGREEQPIEKPCIEIPGMIFLQGRTGLLGAPVSTMTCRGVTLGDDCAWGRSRAWDTCTFLVCAWDV